MTAFRQQQWCCVARLESNTHKLARKHLIIILVSFICRQAVFRYSHSDVSRHGGAGGAVDTVELGGRLREDWLASVPDTAERLQLH